MDDPKNIDWQDAVEMIKPHVVKILTPQGWGTGFLIANSRSHGLCGIATAAHVVNHAHFWEEPIRVEHYASGDSLVVRHTARSILLAEGGQDTAAIVFDPQTLPLPDRPLELTPEGHYLKIGNPVGWVGFPVIAPIQLCFFGGRASAWLESDSTYLIDGVAVNGVSGGPAFSLAGPGMMVIGAISAYRANRATGEALPGLAVVTDVAQFHGVINSFKSLEAAKEQESTAAVPRPPEESTPGDA